MQFSAPGKIVLWGEYAVLGGAPAAVAAVDHVAVATLEPRDSYWRYSSRGLLAPAIVSGSGAPPNATTAHIAHAIARHWQLKHFALGFSLTSDSRAFFHKGLKLGIGSSAAMTVATYRALAHFLQIEATLDDAIAIHQALQGGGSGLDVAASWHGGVIKFQQGHATPLRLPTSLRWQVVWTGEVASTAKHLSGFNSWRQRGDTSRLIELATASSMLCDTPSNANLETYVESLQALDSEAELNIYTQAHTTLATIARDLGIVYKPCGAGGGDIGVALAWQAHEMGDTTDGEADTHVPELRAFRDAAQKAGFYTPTMEIATHGVRQQATEG